MSRGTVSVIVPNFNHAKFLRKRIDSVLMQTYRDFEVIILDDCSTDDSISVIEEYREHPHIKHIVINFDNSGSPFLQWQKGLELATGEWVWIAESDDYADQKFLEIMLGSLGDRSNVGLIYCDSSIVIDDIVQSESFGDMRNRKLNTTRWSRGFSNKGLHEIEEYVLPHGCINNTSAVVFKADILRRADIFDQYFKYVGDKYAFIKVLCLSDIRYVSQRLNFYRAFGDLSPKHTNDYFQYVREQFFIFSWVRRNVASISRKKFNQALTFNTEISFVKMSRKRVAILYELFKLDSKLLTTILYQNLMRSLQKVYN